MQNFEEYALLKIPIPFTKGKKVICKKWLKTLKTIKIHLKQKNKNVQHFCSSLKKYTIQSRINRMCILMHSKEISSICILLPVNAVGNC